nr:MAG TPA: hypothetical protein [Bacteriophage sp.]
MLAHYDCLLTQQPQGIAISILLKLCPKINGKILGIAEFRLQS